MEEYIDFRLDEESGDYTIKENSKNTCPDICYISIHNFECMVEPACDSLRAEFCDLNDDHSECKVAPEP